MPSFLNAEKDVDNVYAYSLPTVNREGKLYYVQHSDSGSFKVTKCMLTTLILLWGLQTLYFMQFFVKNPSIVRQFQAVGTDALESLEKIAQASAVQDYAMMERSYNFHHTAREGRIEKTSQEDDQFSDEQFIYVYDIGSEYNEDLMNNDSIVWWSSQYEPEYEIFDMLAKQKISVTKDPEKATLFYVPFLAARYFLQMIPNDKEEVLRNAIKETSLRFKEILDKIKKKYPYFDRNNGKDHFSVLSNDHGRCSALTFIDPKEYGEMFFFQINADKLVRSSHIHTSRGIQVLSYNYDWEPKGKSPDIPCYMPDRDIAVPAKSSVLEITKPFATNRTTTVLFRFAKGQHHGVPTPYFHHLLRKELLDMYKGKGYEGWNFDVKKEIESKDDWKESQFCICPGGHSQWTSRPSKAILSGCIPVTFFREHDVPWQDDMDYTKFSLNIDVDKLDTLKPEIDKILQTPGKLHDMEKELAKIQESYYWGDDADSGARWYVMKALRRRAQKLTRWTRQQAKRLS